MSLRIVPAASHATSYTHAPQTASAPSASGLYDTLRQGVGPSTSSSSNTTTNTTAPTSRHPLEARLRSWEATQESLRMETLRRAFGIAEPVRRGMELKMAREGSWTPAVLASGGGAAGGRGVHEDILRGRDTSCDWEDVFPGDDLGNTRPGAGVHEEMERKLRI